MIQRALAEYIVNALWQIPLLAAGAWLLLFATKPAPLLQHRLWLAILGMSLLLPMYGIGKAGSFAMHVRNDSVSVQAAPDRRLPNNEERGMGQHWPQFPLRIIGVRFSPVAVDRLIVLYLAIVLFCLFGIVKSWRMARRLVKCSRNALLSNRHQALMRECSSRFRVKPPELRESDQVSSPSIVGVVAPVLLLPKGFTLHSEAEVKAALCHELAHIRRHDYLVNLICEIAALPVAWHPATRGVQRRISRTREMVCDAMAAEEMKSQVGYAKCLLALARSMPGEGAPAQFLGLFSNNILEERVMRLMETKTVMSARAKAVRVASGATAMIAAIGMAAMFHLSPTMAQTKTPPLPETAQSGTAASKSQPATPPSNSAASPLAVAHGDRAHVAGKENGTYIHRWKGADGKPFVVLNRQRREPTSEEQRRVEAEFKQRMQAMQEEIKASEMSRIEQQVKEATAVINSPEFKRQMQEVQDQTKALDMSKIQQQVKAATAEINSPEFKRQMQKIQEETKALDMAEIQQQVKVATAEINNPEFKLQMQEMNDAIQRQINDQMRQMNKQLQQMNKHMQKTNKQIKTLTPPHIQSK